MSEIERLRYQLNHLIENECDFEDVYSISIELDKLIVDYYKSK